MSSQLGTAGTAVPSRGRAHRSRGMVTVELAVGLVTAVVLTATLAGVVLLGVAQAACARTSSEVARQVARGDAAAAHAAEEEAPEGALTRIEKRPEGVLVRVSAPVSILGVGFVQVAAENWAAWEPGVGDDAG